MGKSFRVRDVKTLFQSNVIVRGGTPKSLYSGRASSFNSARLMYSIDNYRCTRYTHIMYSIDNYRCTRYTHILIPHPHTKYPQETPTWIDPKHCNKVEHLGIFVGTSCITKRLLSADAPELRKLEKMRQVADEIPTECPSSLAKLVPISSITMVYCWYIMIYRTS